MSPMKNPKFNVAASSTKNPKTTFSRFMPVRLSSVAWYDAARPSPGDTTDVCLCHLGRSSGDAGAMTRLGLGRLLSAQALLVTVMVALSAAAVAVPGPATGPTTRADPAPALEVGKPAWVSVSVATVWRSTTSPREVDAPALAAPV